MNEHPKGLGSAEDSYAEMARRIEETKPKDTLGYYWVNTLRGNQPRCQNCNSMLTAGPGTTVTESECPKCHMNLRDNGAACHTETR